MSMSDAQALTGIPTATWRPETPPAALPVPDDVVEWAIQTVERMDVVTEIAAWKEDSQEGPGGRPETFSVRALLVAMVIAAHTNQALHATVFCNTLFTRITPRMRDRLELPEPPGELDLRGWKAAYRNTRTRLHVMLDLMDASILPKNQRLVAEDFEHVVERKRSLRGAEDLALRDERLTWFCNRILEASIALLSREYRRRWRGSIAADATPVRAFARMPRQNFGEVWTSGDPFTVSSTDPDGGFYRREHDWRDGDPAPTQTSKTM